MTAYLNRNCRQNIDCHQNLIFLSFDVHQFDAKLTFLFIKVATSLFSQVDTHEKNR